MNINPHHQPRLLTCHTDNFLRQNCTLNTSGWLNSEARAFRRLAQQSEEFGSGRKSGQRFSSELGTIESYVKDSEIKDSARKCLVAKRTRGFPMRPGAVVEAVKSTVLTFQFMALTYMAP
jgi:hypothetical protein